MQLLDLVGGEAERLGLDLDVRRRELRQDVDRRAAERDDAQSQHSDGHAEHQETELQQSAE